MSLQYVNLVNLMIACDKQLNENTESTRSSIKTPYIGQDILIGRNVKGKE